MSDRPVASVLIPVHDAADTLAEQLEALAQQHDAPPFEVIVALNRCTDSSRDVAVRFTDRLALRIVVADDRPSAAHARNAAARIARGEHLLFCDADDRVSPHWVARMVTPLVEGRADIVGGRIVVDRTGLPESIYRVRYERFDGRCLHHATSSLLYCLSASMACRRSAFDDVGGFDETFPGAGAEEVDLASRLQRSGYRIGEAPTAELSYRPRTTLRGAHAQQRSYARGNMLLAAKEGRLQPRPSAPLVASRVASRIGWSVLKRHEWRPTALGLAAADTFVQHREIRRVRDAGYVERPRSHDFPVPVTTPVLGGLAFAASEATHWWYASSGVEQQTMAIVRALLPEGGTFVDVGANVGLFAVAAALLGADVVAFEPADDVRLLLERNLLRHRVTDRVTVHPMAVGDRPGSAEFFTYDNDVVSGLTPAPAQFGPGAERSRAEVTVTTLDRSLPDRVDLVKIDVEGHEPAVLDGATEVLHRNPGAALLVELNPTAMRAAGADLDELLRRLPRERWDLHLVDELRSPHLRPFDTDTERWVRRAPDEWYANLLAVPVGRAVPALAG